MTKTGTVLMSKEAPSVLSGLAFLTLMTRFHNFAAPSHPRANSYSLSAEYLGRFEPWLSACRFGLKDKTTLLLLVPFTAIVVNKHGAGFIAVRLNQAKAFHQYPQAGRLAIFILGMLWKYFRCVPILNRACSNCGTLRKMEMHEE